MTKKSKVIIGVLILLIVILITSIYIFNNSIEVSKEKLREYQEMTIHIDKSLKDHFKDGPFNNSKKTTVTHLAMLYGVYYEDTLINPWADEDNPRKDFHYKLMELGEKKYKIFLIDDDNTKYVDKNTGAIKEIENPDNRIILVK